MINNNDKLNSLIPFQNTQPLAPSSTQKGKGVQSPSSKVSTLSFPETSTQPVASNTFTTKKAQMSDSLLQELDRILQTQAEQIEIEFKELENQAKDKELIDAILGIEGWGYNILSYTNTGAQSGVDFLGKVLPHSILDQMPPAQKWEELGSIASLGATLLSALDTGAQGVALICKHKILERSKEFLKDFKENYAKQLAFEQADLRVNEHKEGVLHAKHKKMQKAIDAWELQIAIEEKALKEEKFQFGLNATSQALTLITAPLSYIPKEIILQQLNLITSGLSWAVSGIEIFGMAIELQKTGKDSKALNRWMEAYQKWQDEHLPKFEMTDKGAKRVGFTPGKPVILSPGEHENVLFATIKNNPLSYTRTKLKECGIEMPSTITKKRDLVTYLKSRPDLIQKYIHFQRQLESLNTIIYTSENLLAKRQAIMNKKVLLLKSRFTQIEPQIRERKKQAFVRDLQRLKEALQDPQCTVGQLDELLNKWQLFTPAIQAQNQQLISAFDNFKHAQLQKKEGITPLGNTQQHLLDELNSWTGQDKAIDQHFEIWFEAQDKEVLIRDYIDHQETIEHTTKNALKQMVQQKHELESRFQKFKHVKSKVLFAVAAISLTVSIAFAILGLLSIPFGGAGLVLLALSIGSATLSLGFLAAGYIQSRRYKPHTTKELTALFQIKMAWAKLRSAISTYSHQSKEKKLIEVAKILQKLHQSTHRRSDKLTNPEYQKALADYQEAKRNFEMSQKKVNYWTNRLKKFESKINEAGWKDFVQYAGLSTSERNNSLDTLTALQSAFQACDLRLLSTETRSLLEVQLGINVEHLQAQMKKDPEGIKNSLQEFFALGDSGLTDFIKAQRARIKKGLLKPQFA